MGRARAWAATFDATPEPVRRKTTRGHQQPGQDRPAPVEAGALVPEAKVRLLGEVLRRVQSFVQARAKRNTSVQCSSYARSYAISVDWHHHLGRHTYIHVGEGPNARSDAPAGCSWCDSGRHPGVSCGCPPELSVRLRAIVAARDPAVDRFWNPRRPSMLQISVATLIPAGPGGVGLLHRPEELTPLDPKRQ